MKWYYWLIIAILAVVGISTLIPAPGSPKNLIGYSSVDPAAPISGIILWVIAGVVYWFGKRKEKKL
jgi:hypothetical protein